ncbi:MAG: hypothetical protein A3K83_05335 [Omnitrophica WOR_2 bacterium RBG_13_44_8b]|nr:MAG: hypothetical protein A3K83_05335 [Omnitrophica WOR_2 bacterium RBG_13_44_8b]
MCKDNDNCVKEHEQEKCDCPSGRMVRFVEPCLLFLLAQKTSYGYELMDKLEQFGLLEDEPDPAMVYRTLRYLEKEEFVKSKWDTKGAGPAKRNYEITQEGVDLLHVWAKGIRQRRDVLDKFLELYKKHFKDKNKKK